ncbi:DUF3244 domain-containing protein [Parabacteroides faecis]|uniref:DUF3244 domain-containing protein n=1 Tax=Parabacteroides faecis TaxID=1217282 RepID=A0ABR6KU42_9BACT|nr:DUF3244 domain-containing protein [Parabacteroides faecis]MBB4624313.1 hypothetical protein [Parabacteroides faecis]GGK17816.1 hypothetical protein GCM10007084_46370 [Parabacteroides faecis]
MKRKMISVLLTIVMICSTTFFVKADQVEIRRTKSQGGVRSILLDPSHLMVNLNNNVIHVDFLFLLRDVNVSVVSSDGRQVHQQVISPQTSSVDIDLSGEESGVYMVYFTDATGVCLYGKFVIL